MSNSSLICYKKLSPNCNKPRNHKIDKITIHHMAGDLTIEECGDMFASPSRNASSNYGIGKDGRIALYVEEKNRSWCSSSPSNDHRAITIEVANDGGAPNWHVSDKAMSSLIKLCVDICRRNNISKLNYTGNANGNLTMHQWFANTECPGPYLKSKFPWIASEVNKRLKNHTPSSQDVKVTSDDSSRYILDRERKINSAVTFIVDVANDNRHGYDQGSRWGSPDYDCSSLVITAYEQAGVKVKTAGATYTGNMLSTFLRCGFSDVTQSITLSTGRGLIKGDVLLNTASHTAMYIGNGKVAEARINEHGNITGGRPGDQTGNEIAIDPYYSYPWTNVLRYNESGAIAEGDIVEDEGVTSENTIDISSIDYTKFKPYMITIDRTSPTIQYSKMKAKGVIGVMIEAGYLYSSLHREVTFKNPKVDSQVSAANKANVPYAFYMTARAQTVAEAQKEMYELSFVVRKYPPEYGVWIQLNLSKSKSVNDKIVDTYYSELVRMGLKGKIGFYVSKSQLSKITWSKYKDKWYLWIDEHVKDVKDLNALLTPEFFDI